VKDTNTNKPTSVVVLAKRRAKATPDLELSATICRIA
jgi:hypothetical protein